MGPVIIFILLTINNLRVPTARAERSAVRTCSTDHFRRENRTQSKHAKSTKRSTFACLDTTNSTRDPLPEVDQHLLAWIQPTVREIRCQKLLGGASRYGSKENTVKARSTTIICMPAVVQTPNHHSTVQCSVYYSYLHIMGSR